MRGSALEAIVRRSADKAKDAGLWLVQTGPRFAGKVTGPAGEAQGRLVAAGALDFIGDLHGRAVTFDAKSCAIKTAFPLKDIRPHQAVIVKRAHRRGAVSFFLVEFSALAGGPRYFALTWPVLEPYWRPFYHSGSADGSSSIPLRVFEAECLEVGCKGKTLDLAGAIEALAAEVTQPSAIGAN